MIPGRCDRLVPARTLLADGGEVRCLLYEDAADEARPAEAARA
jgi:hypothetical protein